jgi:hypothetical protein
MNQWLNVFRVRLSPLPSNSQLPAFFSSSFENVLCSCERPTTLGNFAKMQKLLGISANTPFTKAVSKISETQSSRRDTVKNKKASESVWKEHLESSSRVSMSIDIQQTHGNLLSC